MIQEKVVDIKASEEPLMLTLYESFGYEVVSISRGGVLTHVSLKRDTSMQGYQYCREQEMAYEKCFKPFPLGGIITAVIGGLAFIPLAFVSIDWVRVIIIVVASIVAVIGVLLIVAWLLMKINRHKIILAIIQGPRETPPAIAMAYQENKVVPEEAKKEEKKAEHSKEVKKKEEPQKPVEKAEEKTAKNK